MIDSHRTRTTSTYGIHSYNTIDYSASGPNSLKITTTSYHPVKVRGYTGGQPSVVTVEINHTSLSGIVTMQPIYDGILQWIA